jgi:hypothetical protein
MGATQPVDAQSRREVSRPRGHMVYFYPVGAFCTSILSIVVEQLVQFADPQDCRGRPP